MHTTPRPHAAQAAAQKPPRAATDNFSAWPDGAPGPQFSWPLSPQRFRPQGAAWPRWSDRLEPAGPELLAEGGLRLQGRSKSGNADQPLVSYVTVVRNNTKTLARTLESVQRQTYANVEHIVLDGASTDGTLDIIRQGGAHLDYFASEPDAGLYDALNKAIPLARGQCICVLNSDDWLEPDAAQTVARHMRGRPDKTLLATGASIHDAKGKARVWSPSLVHPGSYLICANDCHNAIYATPQAYEASGPYDSTYKIAADFKWIMACLDEGVQFLYTQDCTVNYALGGISSNVVQHSLECLRIVRERFPYLSEQEVRGLYWCFYAFLNTSGPHMDFTGPKDHMGFLRGLLCLHADRPELALAVSWASLSRLRHPFDPDAGDLEVTPEAASFSRCLVSAAQALLRCSPRLYDGARRLYRRIT